MYDADAASLPVLLLIFVSTKLAVDNDNNGAITRAQIITWYDIVNMILMIADL